ncbi:MAG TPA: heme biosynthesis HemY N-terminal domain-containing protein [Beijerinckiaceae bacterium]|nr:heme biosynthesis HemY N-terminal domain-containing protein [Beijerinckiaceae bacterium]
MWRALVFIGLLALASFGAVWLANHPETVTVTWQNNAYEAPLAAAVVLFIGLAIALAFLWAVVRFILSVPNRMTYASRARKRAKGYAAVSRGMVAVGAGDSAAARRHAGEAERLLGREPLTLLLTAQAAQIAGDRSGAETAFRRMAEDSETRVLGLRGLFVEARRRGDAAAARSYAAEAARLAPAVGWANEAVLEAQCADQDWRGALATVERRASLGLLDKTTARRHRAVLLTADALARRDHDEDGALASAQEALKLAPDLVPAAAVAGQVLSRRADLRKAARIVEAAWKVQPHPDLAEVYMNLRPGDSALDRLHRAETLAKLSSWDPEARLALARAALEAREFARARDVLRPLLDDRPTVRACLLMADLEQAEHGTTGRVREWLARAARAPRDPAWIADGVASDRWAPVSPVTGRLDAFVWQAPPDLLSGPGAPIDDVVADLDDKPAAIAPPAPNEEAPAPVIAPIAAAAAEAPSAEPTEPPIQPAASPAREPVEAGGAARPGNGAAPEASKPLEQSRDEDSGPAPVVFPVAHPPDDPGMEAEAEKPARRRLLG